MRLHTSNSLPEKVRFHLSAVASVLRSTTKDELANADSWLNILIMPAGSLRALLDQAIDYAGMFPPCALALEPALQNQASYVRSPEAWMLNGYVLSVGQFDAATRFLSEFDRHHSLRVAALGPTTTSTDAFLDALANAAAAIRLFSKIDTDLASVSHLEMFLPDDVDSASLKESSVIVDELQVFWEASPDSAEQAIALIAGHNSDENTAIFGYKLRTGGVTADAFPSSAQIASALVTAASNQLPIKFTAGLHHPIRQFRDEVKAKMHGFLNVLGAAVLSAEHQWDVDQAVMILEDEDPASFSFTDDFFAWRDWKIDTQHLQDRRKLVRSFGSCSFEEPCDDLRALGLW